MALALVFVIGAIVAGLAQAAVLIVSRPARLGSGWDLLWVVVPAAGLALLLVFAQDAL